MYNFIQMETLFWFDERIKVRYGETLRTGWDCIDLLFGQMFFPGFVLFCSESGVYLICWYGIDELAEVVVLEFSVRHADFLAGAACIIPTVAFTEEFALTFKGNKGEQLFLVGRQVVLLPESDAFRRHGILECW